MSKAILVIDMPEHCEECEFYDGVRWCEVLFAIISINPATSRAKACPLRPLPEPIERDGYFSDGWNACLDKITGGGVDGAD